MGAWGLASDENDPTWDEACVGMERAQGLGPLDITNHRELVAYLREKNPNGFSAGLTIWLLKLGCGLHQEELQKCLNELQEEMNAESSPYGEEAKDARHDKIRGEIDMVTAAMSNSQGYAPDDFVVGVLGIPQVMFCKGDGTPWHAPIRRLEDGTLVPKDTSDEGGP